MADGLAERTRPRNPHGGSDQDDEFILEPDGDIGAAGHGDELEGAEELEAPVAWSELWQVPTILASVMLIVAGLVVAMHRAPKDDFEGALGHVEQLLLDRRLEEAARGLSEVLEPHLDIATVPQRARFHACVADWISLAQQLENVDRESNNLRIHEQYGRTVELGYELSAPRLERWGHALISLDMLHEARRRIADLDAIDRRDPEAGARAMQGRLFRRVIERMIAQPQFDATLVMELLAEYRADRRSTRPEQVWAIARQADVRIETGRPQEAIDRLLIDMRRLEHEAGDEPLDVGELYALLGRAYFDLGRYEHARANLRRVTDNPETVRSAIALAHDLLGRIAASEADLEVAFEHFDVVVRDFVGTRNHPSALLGRAEALSALGNHEGGREDYTRLVQLLAEPADRRTITANRVAASLVDRHDSSLTRGDLKTALSYAKIAETLFEPNRTPVDVLLRVATTSRQIADDLIVDLEEREYALLNEEVVRQRHEANIHYRQAGDFFIRHARSLVALPGRDEDWATSLWNGADSYDLGGLYDLAITHFEEYLAGRSQNDPRRSEVTFRLAQCHHSLTQYEEAATYYEQVIAEHPRSTVATRSYVPLAQCYMALGRRPEAEQQLKQVLTGLLPIQPSAIDYRDALLELANIYYQTRNHAAAIERYHEAVERYPDDPQRLITKFRLADSYRSLALNLDERLRPPSPDSPGERRRMEGLRRDHLQKARQVFAEVTAGFSQRDPARLEPNERDVQRLADLYRADCAYLLGNYEDAITLYDQAARRYADHHSSMHALVQIVNAYSALGDHERARLAHRRALSRLGRLNDDAFEAPDALMDRNAWERWLANAPVMALGSAFDIDAQDRN